METAGRRVGGRQRAALRWMLAGFLMSFLGSSLLNGASSGLVSAGMLPVAWLAVLVTVETTIDLASPVAARLMRGLDPGRVLVAVEGADAAACLLCLVLLLGFHAPAEPVFIAYMLGIAILPLVIDVAEEMFVAEAGRGSAESVLRFNAVAFSLTAGVALLVARPLGALVSDVSVSALFLVNFMVSLLALVTRRRAVRLSGAIPAPGPDDTPPAVGDRTAMHRPTPRRLRKSARDWLMSQHRLGVASPLLSGGLGFLSSVYSAYLPIWIAGPGKSRQAILALALAAFGLGRVLGPVVGSRLAHRAGLERGLVWCLLGLVGALATMVFAGLSIPSGTSDAAGIALALGIIAALGIGASASVSTLISARQIRLSGDLLTKTIGLGHAFSAGGAVLGAWTGVALAVQNDPTWGVGISAAVGALLVVWLLRAPGSLDRIPPMEIAHHDA